MDTLDATDIKILSYLSKDAYMPHNEIAKHVHVSPGTVHVRLKKLEKMKLIKHAELKVDYQKLGYDIVAFLGIFLKESSLYGSVADQLQDIPEVMSINYTTGNYGIFAKVICKDTQHLMKLLSEKIQKVSGIERTETFISLEERFNRPLDLEKLNP